MFRILDILHIHLFLATPFIFFPALSQHFVLSLPAIPMPGLKSRVNTYGDLDAVIGEDEGGVGASELGSRHGGRRGGWTGLESREGWG